MTTKAGILVLLGAAVLAAEGPNRLTKQERAEGYVLLFDGKTLAGWDGDPALWRVEDGAIAGCSDDHAVQVNTFLIYQQPYSDFVLKCDVRLRNHNSGIQFRSVRLPGPGWIVAGYQADISDAGGRSAWGNFYEERGRGRGVMRTPDEGWQKAKAVLRPHDWNRYEIFARGPRIRLTFNGVVTVDTEDHKTRAGVIAFQLHAGEPMKVEFRNIKLKTLR